MRMPDTGSNEQTRKREITYLTHAAYQKVDWYPWSEEVFEKALLEDKPVFLSSGAICATCAM